MDLPNDSIGITDLLGYRDCPRRMSYGMKRHTGIGLQSDDKTPEAGSYATWYGSAIHDVVHDVEDGFSDDEAIQRAWDKFGVHLGPGDLDQMRTDLAVYHTRNDAFPATRIVALEDEFRVPLLMHEGRTIYFRFKLDRLLERLDQPGSYIHVDYKSSRTVKTQADVNADLQMWAYNFGVHEFFPEVERLEQFYDQLKFGMVPTRKTDGQRRQMREWLERTVRAVLNDEDWRTDDLLRPKKNDWCSWCPILETCPVVHELTDYAATTIAALSPRRPKLKKDGTPGKLMEDVPLDASRLPEYVGAYVEAKDAQKILDRFTTNVSELIKRLPADEQANVGFQLGTRKATVFPEAALRAMHERMGPEFYSLLKLTKARLEEYLEGDPELLEWALAQGLEIESHVLKAVRSP